MFENEREKETFYIESILRRIISPSSLCGDILNSCRISRNLSLIRQLLNEYGKTMKLPKSFVSVDEDFHYMCGEKWIQ